MKPYYHTFEWKDRVITLCLVSKKLSGYIQAGYSVKLPEDPQDQQLAKKIALGRALKKNEVLNNGFFGIHTFMDYRLAKDRGILNALSRNIQRQIESGKIVIKGIR